MGLTCTTTRVAAWTGFTTNPAAAFQAQIENCMPQWCVKWVSTPIPSAGRDGNVSSRLSWRPVCCADGLPWTVHVRRTHAHAVISAARAGVTVRRVVKTCATRGLHRRGFDPSRRRKWTRKGSVLPLWNQGRLEAAIVYVVREQGEPMELFVHPHASRFIYET